MDLVFLGVNNTGWEIYEWLCNRDGVNVQALITTREQLSLIRELKPDIVVGVGYQHIIPDEYLSVPEEGCINVHPGYLPHTRGFNPNVWSIVEDLPAGVTIHYMDAGIDTGDIIARCQVDDSFEDTGKSLYRRIETASVELFIDTWPDIESGEIDPIQQVDEEATFHEKSDFKELCQIDPAQKYTAKEFLNILRALTFPPFDNAFVEIDGTKYYLEIEINASDENKENDQFGMVSSY